MSALFASNFDQFEPELFDGRFEVLFPLGRGRNTVTYKARLISGPSSGKEVVLKVWNPKSVDAISLKNPIRVEALALLSARSKHIVRLLDFVDEPNRSYLVTDFADGLDLATELERRSVGFPVEDALNFVAQLLEAVDVVHRAGLIHCNIRPEKIFLREDGSLILAGFSAVANATEQDKAFWHDVALTDDCYSAPETIREGFISTRGDLYSIGIILYQLISGKLPFQGKSGGERYQEKIGESWLPLSYHTGIANLKLERCVKKALSSSMERRFATAAEFLDSICEIRREVFGVQLEEENRLSPSVSPKKVRVRESFISGTHSEMLTSLAHKIREIELRTERSGDEKNDATRRDSRRVKNIILAFSFLVSCFLSLFLFRPASKIGHELFAKQDSSAVTGVANLNSVGAAAATGKNNREDNINFRMEFEPQKTATMPGSIRVFGVDPKITVLAGFNIDGEFLSLPLKFVDHEKCFVGSFPTPQGAMKYKFKFVDGEKVSETTESDYVVTTSSWPLRGETEGHSEKGDFESPKQSLEDLQRAKEVLSNGLRIIGRLEGMEIKNGKFHEKTNSKLSIVDYAFAEDGFAGEELPLRLELAQTEVDILELRIRKHLSSGFLKRVSDLNNSVGVFPSRTMSRDMKLSDLLLHLSALDVVLDSSN